MTDHSSNLLAGAIRARRGELGLSQEQAAERAGVSPSAWRNLETGRTSGGPRAGTAAGVERALQWPAGRVAALVAGEAPTGLSEAAREEVAMRLAGGYRREFVELADGLTEAELAVAIVGARHALAVLRGRP